MDVKNQGGFRYSGNVHPFNIKRVLLYSTNDDKEWINELNIEIGQYIYHGDNKVPGTALHNTKLHGNEILRDSFNLVADNSFDSRVKVPPFFLFEKANRSDIVFRGLLVPGYKSLNSKDWLTSNWATYKGDRFQNYKAVFTILDLEKGSAFNKNIAEIDLNWLKDIDDGNAYTSKYAPIVWKKWVETGNAKALIVENKNKSTHSQLEQLPKDKNKISMLKLISERFSSNSYEFEKFAIYIATIMDDHIISLDQTRAVKDGGRDGIGLYQVGKGEHSVRITFALEAKCYKYTGDTANGVGVKEMSRLISRIKHREFGIFVTTSYVSTQAYKEIIEDGHPIIIISGSDIVDILYENGINSIENLEMLLLQWDI